MSIDKAFEPLYPHLDGSVRVCVADADGYTLSADCSDAPRIAERMAKTLLWAKGGITVYCTDRKAAEAIGQAYSPGGARAFDSDFMQKIYLRPFRVVYTQDPPLNPAPCKKIGGNRGGKRVGLDLGGSEIKLVAIDNGRTVLENRIAWQPKLNADPEYHFEKVCLAVSAADRALGGVQAVGISSAGVIVNNEPRISSLFHSVPPEAYGAARQIFLRLRQQYPGVRIAVANDGDVAALAGSEAMGERDLLGLSLGTSLAGGALKNGRINGWLNELAFVPIAVNRDAAADEWSGDRGCGVNYLCQDAVLRLSAQAGFSYKEGMTLSEKMHLFADRGGALKEDVFGDVGRYLGWALPVWKTVYGIDTVLITGGVTAAGGSIIRQAAGEQLKALGQSIRLLLPDSRLANVGQAAAAAGLAEINGD